MQTEEWRKVKGSNFYEVSSLSRVRSLDRILFRGPFKWRLKGRILKQTQNNSGYLTVSVRDANVTKLVHRLYAQAFLDLKLGYEVDHKNLTRADNDPTNLRVANRGLNTVNRKVRSDSKSGVKGVAWDNDCRKWRAVIYVKRKGIQLGLFTRIEDAGAAFQKASKERYGEFARQ